MVREVAAVQSAAQVDDLRRWQGALILARWVAVPWAVLTIATRELPPYPPGFRSLALALIAGLAAGNVVIRLLLPRARTRQAAWWLAIASLALDVTVCSAFVWLHAFDAGSAFWALLFILPLEGALLFGLPGALTSWAATAIGYTARDLWRAGHYGYVFSANSVAFRMGIGFLIALVAALMARDLLRQRRLLADALGDVQASEERTRRILATADLAFVSIDERGAITHWNPAAVDTFGWSADEAIGADLAELVIPAHLRSAHRAGLRRFLRNGEHALLGRSNVELTARHRDGHEFPAELAAWSLHDGNAWTFNAFVRDISQRRQVEAALRESEARLVAAQRLARLGSWEWDASTDTLRWSDELQRIYGLQPGAFEGTYAAFLARVHADDRPHVEATVAAARARPGSFTVEHRIVLPDGKVRVLHGEGQALHDDGGQLVRMIGTGQDVTAARQAEAELQRSADDLATLNARLREANEFKDRFVATTNHELRTPLTTILGFATTLREHWSDIPDDDRRQFVGRIEHEGRRLATLIEDLLTLSSVDAGELGLELQPVDVGAVVEEALRCNGLGDGDVTIAVPAGLQARSDARRLTQILTNFLANAVKHGSAPITVEAEAWGDDVRLAVRDHGRGVPPDFVPALFERFRQASSGTPRTAGGSGLGLAIAKELALAQGGRVGYEANTPGGACFWVTAPAVRAAAVAGRWR